MIHLTGGMIAAAAAGVSFALAAHALAAFVGGFIQHFGDMHR